MRWSNAKILAVIGIILGILGNFEKLKTIPVEHHIPILSLVCLILVALFDACLDLEAEWTMCTLATARGSHIKTSSNGLVSQTLFHANQFGQPVKLLEMLRRSKKVRNLSYAHFTRTAKNLIAFAIVVVPGIIIIILTKLFQMIELPSIFICL